MSDRNGSTGGIGLMGVLGIVFVVLKLCHQINWSWWWVTLPFYGPMTLVILTLFCIWLGGSLFSFLNHYFWKVFGD